MDGYAFNKATVILNSLLLKTEGEISDLQPSLNYPTSIIEYDQNLKHKAELEAHVGNLKKTLVAIRKLYL